MKETAHTKCIKAGLSGLWKMVELTGVPRSTLIDWHRKNKKRFELQLKLCVAAIKVKGE